MPAAVELSDCTGVGGCGWPMSSEVCLRGTASLQFTNTLPNSASEAEDTTCFSVPHMVCVAPFNSSFSLFDLLLR